LLTYNLALGYRDADKLDLALPFALKLSRHLAPPAERGNTEAIQLDYESAFII
jgi:hypothetical protein